MLTHRIFESRHCDGLQKVLRGVICCVCEPVLVFIDGSCAGFGLQIAVFSSQSEGKFNSLKWECVCMCGNISVRLLISLTTVYCRCFCSLDCGPVQAYCMFSKQIHKVCFEVKEVCEPLLCSFEWPLATSHRCHTHPCSPTGKNLVSQLTQRENNAKPVSSCLFQLLQAWLFSTQETEKEKSVMEEREGVNIC